MASPARVPVDGLAALASHLAERRTALLAAWRERVRADPTLGSVQALSRAELNDHIPALLASFAQELVQSGATGRPDTEAAASAPRDPPGAAHAVTAAQAEAHGLHRWHQGYDLREATRELGLLNECMGVELDAYAEANPTLPPATMAQARRCWAHAFTVAIGESTAQFFRLQQLEAAGHIEELDAALDDVLELERLRAELWQQAAHDLRGNVGVVSNVTAGLALDTLPAGAREHFLTVLQRNVLALNHLLNDVTSLARLQAGEEQRVLGPFDAAALVRELCQASKAQAEAGGLRLTLQGPSSLWVQGDAVKVRRIAQNLLFNALAYTRQGGVDVAWGPAPDGLGKRWMLSLHDTGPGLQGRPDETLAGALEEATALTGEAAGKPLAAAVGPAPAPPATTPPLRSRSAPRAGGEGLGLTIVKRLCDLLDAILEVESQPGIGTHFRVLLPLAYQTPEGPGPSVAGR